MIDLENIAKHLKLALPSLQRVAELLEEGNTVPFITRFRKDQIGGLDEPQVRLIEKELGRAKLLDERKEAILKSIESRGKLTETLSAAITQAKTMGEVEDIYLPYKPKKQSLASLARSRGLEPLASEIIHAVDPSVDINDRARSFVDEANQLADEGAVIEGVKHLVAEYFGNQLKIRAKVRRHLWRNGTLISRKIEQPEAEIDDPSTSPDANATIVEDGTPQPPGNGAAMQETAGDSPSEKTEDHSAVEPAHSESAQLVQSHPETQPNTDSQPSPETSSADASASATPSGDAQQETTSANEPPSIQEPPGVDAQAKDPAADASAPGSPPPSPATTSIAQKQDAKSETASRRDQRRETRRRRRERLVQSFKDYFEFSDPIGRIPHHRILAINRGERTKVLRVKIECRDLDKVLAEAESIAIPPEHPAADFLRDCLQDAMSRLLQPSIEREIRRELTERAEEHAVKVFARNLRKLLLQPPLRHKRVVAIDPGFRSGCKLVALDEFGQLLGHTFINVLGKEKQREAGRAGLAGFVQQHQASVVAVGNGAACRETETLVAEVLSNELNDHNVGYLIVNEAGTSVYSTSDLGREELPDFDATLRSAVSIGRRALDPLSELVKVDPASIGVGLYQHDVKAKHLRESLDAVVESCVNYVGVDVNSASPALLRYVSGLNSLTARRIYQHRQQHGPFNNREQLKDVSGIGDSTYVQAAGFLRISRGENALDGTWIHPESYPIARKVLEAIGFSPDDLQVGRRSEPLVLEPETQSIAQRGDQPQPPTVPDGATATASGSATRCPSDGERDEPSPDPGSKVALKTRPASPVETETASDVDRAADRAFTGDSASSLASISSPASETQTATQPAAAAASPDRTNRMKELTERLAAVDAAGLAPQLGVGKLLLQDILNALARPGRDPREDLPPPIFRTGILKLEDLKSGMELSGTVLNVVDFGAFVDIGLVDSGLIHVSRLADRYVSDPHDVVSVGDILRVWVVDVDQKRRRVSLTAVEPGTEKPKPEQKKRARRKPRVERKGHEGGKTRKPAARKGHKPHQHKPKKPPKQIVPITKEMEEGKEPMRTFGDLKQLFDKKKRGGSS